MKCKQLQKHIDSLKNSDTIITEQSIISDILISANSQTTHVLYEVQQDELKSRVPEDWVFGTYEECIKWCDEHN